MHYIIVCALVTGLDGENPTTTTATSTTTTTTSTPTTTTTTTTATTTTTPAAPRPRMFASRLRSAEAEAALGEEAAADVHDTPLADMPRLAYDYDYSHFEYLNENFDAVYEDTVRHAEEVYSYQYEEYEAASPTEQQHNSDLVQKLKERFSESEAAGGGHSLGAGRQLLALVTVCVLSRCLCSQLAPL